MAKIAVIGAGQVGATAAYTLAESGLAREIAVVDINEKLAKGVAADIAHGVPFMPPVKMVSGGYEAATGADIVIMTAGAAQKPGETRRDLVDKNLKIMQAAGKEIARVAPECILVVVTNPVDVLAKAAAEYTGFDRKRVFGSGTVLDTARLKAMLSAHAGVDPRSIDAYVLGEHGDSEFAAWSLTRIAGMTAEDYCRVCGECSGGLATQLQELFDREVRDAAYAVIEQKGSTCYAIGQALRRICEAILRNEHSILTVSALLDGCYGMKDLCLSVPCVVGRDGVERILEVRLSEEEMRLLKRSAETIRRT